MQRIIDSVAQKVELSGNGMLWTASERMDSSGKKDNNVVFARKMIDENKVSNNLGVIAFGVSSRYLRTLESSSMSNDQGNSTNGRSIQGNGGQGS